LKLPGENGSSISERAAAGPDQQDGLFDKQLDDSTLEAALEERERIKENRREVNAEYKIADEAAKYELARFHLEVGEVARVGRFRIERKATPPRDVSFSTEPGDQLDIKVAD
jgi:hypothetical protein